MQSCVSRAFSSHVPLPLILFMLCLSFLSGCGGAKRVTTPANRTVRIVPASQTVPLGATQQFMVAASDGSIPAVTWAVNGIAGGNASVGTISTGGLYTAPVRLPSPTTIAITAATPNSTLSASVSLISGITSVALTPATARVILGGSTTIDAVVNFDAPGRPDTAVTWWLSGAGSLSGPTATSALYSAPPSGATPAKTVVMAISVADPSKSASITIDIPEVGLTLSPATADVAKGTTLQLTAQVTDATDGNVHWLVNGSEGGDDVSGTVDATGLYRAPVEVPASATVRLTAVSAADSSQAESANIIVRDFIDTSDPWVIGFAPVKWWPPCQFTRTFGWYCNWERHASLEQVAQITFSEAMDPTTLGPGSLPINAPMTRSYNPTTHTLTLTALTGLEYGKEYDLTVQKTVRDLGGNICLGAQEEPPNPAPLSRFSFFADDNSEHFYQLVYVPEVPAAKDSGYIYCLGQAVSDKVQYNSLPNPDPVSPQCPFQAGAITPVTVMFQGDQFGYLDMYINTGNPATGSYLSTIVGDGLHVDEFSTAETLVFLAPQIARDPKDSKWVTDIIHNDPAVKQFAAVIAATASSLAVPQEDPGFQTAYAAAVNSVLGTITAVNSSTHPANGKTAVTSATHSASGEESTSEQPDAWESAGVQLFNMDTGLPVLSDFEIRLQGDSLLLHSRTTPYGKLNWLTDLAAIDPAALPASLQELTGQEVFPRLDADCGLLGPLAPCEVQFPLTSDESIISLARTPQDWSTVLPQADLGVEIAIPYKSKTAYVLRRYSGGMANVDERTSLIPRVPGGPALDRLALQNNISSLALGAVLRASPGIKCNLIPQAYAAADKAILANVDLSQVDQMSLQKAMADTMRGIADAASTTAGCFGSPVTLNFIIGTIADLVETTPFDMDAPLGITGEQLKQLLLVAAPLETDILTIGDIPTAQVCYLGVSPETLDLSVGESAELSAVTNDCTGNVVTGAFVTWTSSDPQIAYVSANGVVTGRAAGTASIMIRAGTLTYRTIPVTVH